MTRERFRGGAGVGLGGSDFEGPETLTNPSQTVPGTGVSAPKPSQAKPSQTVPGTGFSAPKPSQAKPSQKGVTGDP